MSNGCTARLHYFIKMVAILAQQSLRSPGTCFLSPWVPFAIQLLTLIPSKVWFSPQVISFTFTGSTTIHIHSTSWYTSDAVYLNYIWLPVGQFYLNVSQILCGQNQTHLIPWSDSLLQVVAPLLHLVTKIWTFPLAHIPPIPNSCQFLLRNNS